MQVFSWASCKNLRTQLQGDDKMAKHSQDAVATKTTRNEGRLPFTRENRLVDGLYNSQRKISIWIRRTPTKWHVISHQNGVGLGPGRKFRLGTLDYHSRRSENFENFPVGNTKIALPFTLQSKFPKCFG